MDFLDTENGNAAANNSCADLGTSNISQPVLPRVQLRESRVRSLSFGLSDAILFSRS